MPGSHLLSTLLGPDRTSPFSRRRLILFGGGGLLLVVLLALQSALESAGPASPPPATPAPGAAGAIPDYGSFTTPQPETAWWMVVSGLALKLAVVVLLIYATVWVLKRYLGRPAGPTPTGGTLRLLQSMPLAQNQFVHLVQVGDRVLVVGATPQQVTLLTEVRESAAVGELRLAAGEAATPPGRSFGEHLADLGRADSGPAPRPAAAATERADQPPAHSAPIPNRPAPRATPAARPTAPAPARPRPGAAGAPARLAPRPERQPPPREGRADIDAALREGKQALERHLTALRRGDPAAPAVSAEDDGRDSEPR